MHRFLVSWFFLSHLIINPWLSRFPRATNLTTVAYESPSVNWLYFTESSCQGPRESREREREKLKERYRLRLCSNELIGGTTYPKYTRGPRCIRRRIFKILQTGSSPHRQIWFHSFLPAWINRLFIAPFVQYLGLSLIMRKWFHICCNVEKLRTGGLRSEEKRRNVRIVFPKDFLINALGNDK